MPKFNIGDKVKFHPEWIGVSDVPNLWSHLVDTSKVYTVTWVSDNGVSFGLDDGYDFLYSHDWLEKVDEGRIKDVKFSGPATIVFWTDGTKTVVKCRKGDKFDPEKGIAMACAKKLMGNEDGYHKTIEKHLPKSKTTNGGIESMDTEEIRRAVSEGCNLFTSIGCFSKCPCRFIGVDGTCCSIACGSRDQLIKMLKSFEKAGYFSYEDWRMRHAS